jgi:hypothetical protein
MKDLKHGRLMLEMAAADLQAIRNMSDPRSFTDSIFGFHCVVRQTGSTAVIRVEGATTRRADGASAPSQGVARDARWKRSPDARNPVGIKDAID